MSVVAPAAHEAYRGSPVEVGVIIWEALCAFVTPRPAGSCKQPGMAIRVPAHDELTHKLALDGRTTCNVEGGAPAATPQWR